MRCRFRFWSVCRRLHKTIRIIRLPKNFIKMFLKMWREECHVQKLKLNHSTPQDFTTCCWQERKEVLPIWVAYRTLVFLYFLLTSIYTILDPKVPIKDKYKYMIFLTNWTYQLQLVQFFFAFLITVMGFVREKRKPPTASLEKIPTLYRIYWVLFTISLPASVVVTVIFWSSVYDPELFPADIHNFIVHVFNSSFMILDFCLVGHPVRFLHFYWPSFFALIYSIFSIIYQLSGGTGVKGLIPIYGILDWRHPENAAVTCIFCFLFLLTIHCLFSVLSMFKFWLKKKSLEN